MSIAASTPSSNDRLYFTAFVAVAVHALIILGLTFDIDMEPKPAASLNITLATHKDQNAPEKADFLAQNNQQASGTVEDLRELTVDKQAPIADTQIREITPPTERLRSEQEALQQKVIASNGKSRKINLAQDKQQRKQASDGKSNVELQHSAEIASLHAKLARQRQAYAKRPRIRRITSVATRASIDAEYLSKWASKIEFVGNRNYPDEALRRGITGTLRAAVTLLPNGNVDKVEILHSSGQKLLDRAALQIVYLASPFAPFPNEIRKTTDKLEIIRTWHFEISGLSTSR
ncbi:energy transducer TonB [Pseudoteredinibacter isoporae]|uniref:Protein TonB n=1 Tax=Pseudoteredinibacter isoporae TaxID=570281 RepID=A0A7X0JR86_9GAMM|nr:energy transducer TonB [Pseudoteredinibacter isoporae]MBB6519895.1 protein TonB [Pseudoteredinibacter isoporae]NHO85473.1 energy transducer TonB [Pseudoteredinibacter isoporae]NIB26075.1 energy transducer TonB [Pseudoteredinibacter isoporae]